MSPARFASVRRAAAAAVFAALSVTIGRPQSPAGDPFAARRAALARMLDKGFAILTAQIQTPRGPQESKDFVYLTGVSEPEAVLVLTGEGEKPAALFTRTGRWTGAASPGALDVRPVSELRAAVARVAAGKKGWLPFSGLEATLAALGGSTALAQSSELGNVEPLVAEMRIVKSAEEIETLSRAVAITTEAYIEMLKAARPGMTEIDLRAVLDYVYSRRGATSSFTQIASGPNSVNIHFGATARPFLAGDAIVFDLGAWHEGYTSDISRTIPVSGRFTAAQAEIHGLVLEAELEGISLMTAGRGIQETQTAVEDALLRGLRELGLVTDPASPWQRRIYIQHGFIHGIGLEVHDVWGWFSRRMRQGLEFRPGMVLTMEPGLYFPAGRLDKAPAGMGPQVPEAEWKAFVAQAGPIYKKYEGLGCRIEDDVLVLESGNRVLTAGAPKTAAEIEKTMRLPSPFDAIR